MLKHKLLQAGGDVVPQCVPRTLGCLQSKPAQDGSPRVLSLVYPVAKAKEPLLGSHLGLEPGIHVFYTAYLQELFHRLLAGPTVQRPLQGAQGRHHCGIDVAECAGRHPRREGRGVHAMICQEHKVGLQGGGGPGIRLVAAEHVQEIGCVSQILPRLDRRAVAPQPVKGSHDGRQLGRQAHRPAQGRPSLFLVHAGAVEHGQGRGHCSEGLHGCSLFGQRVHDAPHHLGQAPIGPQPEGQHFQLVVRWEALVP